MDKVHEPKEIDVTGAARGVWLVKVPKYLAERWKKAGPTGEVGKLKISKSRIPGKQDVIFSLNEDLAQKDPGEANDTPRDHHFMLTRIGAAQALSVFSTQPDFESVPLDCAYPPEKVAVEGKVMQRAECKPMINKRYMQLKKTQVELLNKPEKKLIQLDKIVQNYKPRAYHVHDIQAEKGKKEEGKRARMDREPVQELLFNAFEKHQYYNVKDLVRITQQPITWLKEILKEICIYNMKAPHRNMWELKPEYRHYKSTEEKE